MTRVYERAGKCAEFWEASPVCGDVVAAQSGILSFLELDQGQIELLANQLADGLFDRIQAGGVTRDEPRHLAFGQLVDLDHADVVALVELHIQIRQFQPEIEVVMRSLRDEEETDAGTEDGNVTGGHGGIGTAPGPHFLDGGFQFFEPWFKANTQLAGLNDLLSGADACRWHAALDACLSLSPLIPHAECHALRTVATHCL